MKTSAAVLTEIESDPVLAADEAGIRYSAAVTVDHRRDHGLYLTPPEVARFMGGLVRRKDRVIRVLDPAAGAGILVCAVVEALVGQRPEQINVVAYEIDPLLAEALRSVLNQLIEWCHDRGVKLVPEVRVRDFVLANADVLGGFNGLFALEAGRSYDVVIANPPYFKLSKGDPRAQAALSVVHGQPNIYALFMAIGASLLRSGGDLVCITPRSFASGPYFRAFRERFFQMIRPADVHVFGSRRETFSRDAVLQENIILHGVRDDHWTSGEITIGTSAGIDDLNARAQRSMPASTVLDLSTHDRILRIPATEDDDAVLRAVDAWPSSLRANGWNISTGPVVPFRAVEFQSKEGGAGCVPLLWMNHVKPMAVSWPIQPRKPEHIRYLPQSRKLLLPNSNYVLVRRFSAKEEKRRLVAAPYLSSKFDVPVVGLENHLNYIYKPGGALSDDEAFGLAALLNCSFLDIWFRAVNGNTQVSATEIRSMPLPSAGTIALIGRKARSLTLSEIDVLIAQELKRNG